MNYYLKRILLAIPSLLATSLVIYILISMVPGDIFGEFAMSPSVTAEAREAVMKSLGLDQPVHIRYVKWITAFIRGDWGISFTTRQPVSKMIFSRLGTTLSIVGVSFVVGSILAIPLGVVTALKKNSLFDHIITTLSFLGFCLPGFFIGLLFILIFSVKLNWFPFMYDGTVKVTNWASFVKQFKQSIMPIVVLASYETAYLTRYVRSETLSTMNQDFIRTARSKGIYEKDVIVRHIIRNSLMPVVTMVILRIPQVFTGAIITERIFSIPGIGNLLIKSIESNDVPVIVAIIFIYSILVVIFNVIADLLYSILDPRVTYS